jgi:hypothetical protein
MAVVNIGGYYHGKFGFIDKTGRLVIGYQFDDADGFREGLAPVKVGKLWGYVDKTGRFAVEPQFSNASWFSEGLAAVSVGDSWGFIDKSGKLVINPQFMGAVGSFSGGLALMWALDSTNFLHYGYIDARGNVVISPQFPLALDSPKGSPRSATEAAGVSSTRPASM